MKRLGTLQGHLNEDLMERLKTQGFVLYPEARRFERHWKELGTTQVTLQPVDADRISEALHSFSPRLDLPLHCFIAFRAVADWGVYLVPGSHLMQNSHFPRSAAIYIAIPATWTVVLNPRLKHCTQVNYPISATRFLIRLHS